MKNQEIEIKKIYKGEIFKKNQLVRCLTNKSIIFDMDFRVVLKRKESDKMFDIWDDKANEVLETSKVYKVEKFEDDSEFGRVRLFVKVFDDDYVDWFYPDRFISLLEERKRKLKKLCTKMD